MRTIGSLTRLARLPGRRASFKLLAEDITALEQKIAFGRALLRDSITDYNSLVQRFPNNLLAAVTGFRRERLPSG